jgi:hypothetical protein
VENVNETDRSFRRIAQPGTHLIYLAMFSDTPLGGTK